MAPHFDAGQPHEDDGAERRSVRIDQAFVSLLPPSILENITASFEPAFIGIARSILETPQLREPLSLNLLTPALRENIMRLATSVEDLTPDPADEAHEQPSQSDSSPQGDFNRSDLALAGLLFPTVYQMVALVLNESGSQRRDYSIYSVAIVLVLVLINEIRRDGI